MLDLAPFERRVEETREAYYRDLESNAHRDYSGNSARNDYKEAQELLLFAKAGYVPSLRQPGIYSMFGMYIAINTRKCRRIGTNKWFKYKDPASFVIKYGAMKA